MSTEQLAYMLAEVERAYLDRRIFLESVKRVGDYMLTNPSKAKREAWQDAVNTIYRELLEELNSKMLSLMLEYFAMSERKDISKAVDTAWDKYISDEKNIREALSLYGISGMFE